MPRDLFGVEIAGAEPVAHPIKKKRDESPKGYARRPGTGPAGETCGTCRHARRWSGGNKTFYKCDVIAHRHTHSRRTDIVLRSPACELFEEREGERKP